MRRFFVGITGASGHAYARRLMRALVELGHAVDVSITSAGLKVLAHEQGIRLAASDLGSGNDAERAAIEAIVGPRGAERLRFFPPEAIEAPPSSGTSGTEASLIVPCSMGTLARVSAGYSSNLVERAADVALKEGRTLLICPRETPLSAIHLENLLRLARLGAVVLPAMPGFYHRPESLDDLVDHVVGKILDRLGIDQSVGARWDGDLEGGAPPEDPGIESPSSGG